MSRDKREDILSRLFEVAQALAAAEDDATNAYRDRVAFENDELPAYVVLDGNETARITPSDRRGFSIVELTPPMFYIPRPTENQMNVGIGPLISARRVSILKAVMSDGQLLDLCGDNGYIEYRGMQTDMEVGMEVEGHIRMDFAFGYALNFNKL